MELSSSPSIEVASIAQSQALKDGKEIKPTAAEQLQSGRAAERLAGEPTV